MLLPLLPLPSAPRDTLLNRLEQQSGLNSKRDPWSFHSFLSLRLQEIHYWTKSLADVTKMGKLRWKKLPISVEQPVQYNNICTRHSCGYAMLCPCQYCIILYKSMFVTVVTSMPRKFVSWSRRDNFLVFLLLCGGEHPALETEGHLSSLKKTKRLLENWKMVATL